jgi:hypothetical protein
VTGEAHIEEALRARIDALEQELVERTARANAAVAAAQERSYWLDRWKLDLNAVMRKRWARRIWIGVRITRAFAALAAKGPRNIARHLPRRTREILAEERSDR